MNGEHYIPRASTPEQHLNNCQFQAANIAGWLKVGDREAAHVKAECLLRDAESLLATFEALARAERNKLAGEPPALPEVRA